MIDKSKPVVTMDFVPTPKSFGWFGMILYIIATVLLLIVFFNYNIDVTIFCLVLLIVGVYIGRSIESAYYKNKDKQDAEVKKTMEMYNEEKGVVKEAVEDSSLD